MSNQVVTIGYLKDFVNGKLTVSTNMPDTYCPTYGELTGGALVFNYSSASNPKDTVNGIDIPKCTVDTGYTSNQLVIRQDLLLKYMVLDGISIKADSNDIDKCGGSTNICATGTFHLVTKSEDGETDGKTETDTSILVTWDGDADDTGSSTCTVISFGLNAVGNPGTANPTSAPSRDKSTTATYKYKGIHLTDDNETTKTSNTVTVTQGANNVGEWYYVPSEDYATSLVADCPGIISELGGTATVTSTLYYKQRWKADDSCENIVGLKYIDASKTGPTEYHTFEEQDCDADEVTVTVTVSESGQTDSCAVTQEASSVPCFCGNGCPDASCNGKVHWGCAEKKDDTQYDYNCSTAKVLNLNDKGQLPSSGGTATATVDGKSKKGIWTRSAICGNESLPAQIVDSLPSLPAVESSQNTVYLLLDKKGATGGSLSYTDSNGNTQYTYSYTYTSYTQYHYTVWLEDVTVGKKTIKEERWGWISGGTSYIREANSVTTYGYDYVPYYSYEKDLYLANGNSESSWDAAYEPWYEKWVRYNASERFFCDGVEVGTEEEMLNCEGEQERKLDESLNPGTFVIYGSYWTSWTKYGESGTSEMSRVTKCCVRNISTEKDYLVEHLSIPTDITTTATFTYPANTGATEISGTAILTLSGGKTCNVSYKVAPGSTAANNCATVEVTGRRWFISLANAADSDVTYSFNAKNGFEENGKKYDDWVQTITISKGSTIGSASSNLTQHATGATLSSVSPASDAKYNYNCISSIDCGEFTDTYELVVTKEIIADTASAEEYMSVTSKKNGSPYKDFTFSESCSWVTNFQILNPNDTDGVYNVQITLQPNSEQGSRTCNGSVIQTNGKTETFSIVQSGNSSGGDNTGDCILGTTNTMQGGTGSKVTLGTGKTTTVTIYSIDEMGKCTTTPSRTIGDTSIVSSCTAGSLSNTTCSNTWTIIAGNKTGSTNITFSNGCETFTLPIEVTGSTPTLSCMTISYTLSQGAACTVYFKTTNGTQQGSHYVDATGNQQLCNIAIGTVLVASCSDTAVTIGGDTQFTYTHDSTASISLTKTGGGGGTSEPVTCTTSNTWSSISANVSADKCDTSPTVSVTASGTHTNTDCSSVPTSTTVSDYTIKYGTTSGSYTLDNITQNTGSTSKTWYYKVTASSTYGSKTTTGSFTQAGGCYVPPADTTGSTTEYDMQVIDATMAKCDTTAPSITVQGRSRTGKTHTNGTATEWGSWGDWTNLTSSNYTLSYNPSLGENNTSSAKTYTVTATGKGTYAGESATGTITQSAGPCKPADTTGSTTEYEMKVVNTTVDKCATTAPSITVQGRSRTGKTHTDGTATEWGSWGDWSNLSISNYTLSVPTISENTGSTSKSYTVTATGKGTYNGESATGTITQAGGCVTAVTEYNNIISYTFPYTYGGYLHLSVSVNGESITSGIKYSTGSSASNVYLYSFKTKEGDSVDITFYGIGYLDGSSYNYIDPTEPDTYGGDWDGNGGSMSYTSSKNMNITCYMTANGDLGGGGGGIIPPSPTGRT